MGIGLRRRGPGHRDLGPSPAPLRGPRDQRAQLPAEKPARRRRDHRGQRDRLTPAGQIIKTGTVTHRLAHARQQQHASKAASAPAEQHPRRARCQLPWYTSTSSTPPNSPSCSPSSANSSAAPTTPSSRPHSAASSAPRATTSPSYAPTWPASPSYSATTTASNSSGPATADHPPSARQPVPRSARQGVR